MQNSGYHDNRKEKSPCQNLLADVKISLPLSDSLLRLLIKMDSLKNHGHQGTVRLSNIFQGKALKNLVKNDWVDLEIIWQKCDRLP